MKRNTNAYGWNVTLCKVASNRTLIFIRDYLDNGCHSMMNLYEYKNGKLKLLCNLANISKNDNYLSESLPLSSWARGELVSVGKNKLTVKWYETIPSTGILYVNISYKINGSNIERIGSSYTIEAANINGTKKWTAKRKITTYTKAGGNRKAFTIKKGNKVKPVKFTVKNGIIYIQVKNSKGKKGWYKDNATGYKGWFKESHIAG